MRAFMDTSQCTSAPNRGPDLALGGTHGACPWKTWTICPVLRRHTRLTEAETPCTSPKQILSQFQGVTGARSGYVPPPVTGPTLQAG